MAKGKILPPNLAPFPSWKLVQELHLSPGLNKLSIGQIHGFNQFVSDFFKKPIKIHTYAGHIRILLDMSSIEIKIDYDENQWTKVGANGMIPSSGYDGVVLEVHPSCFAVFGDPIDTDILVNKTITWDTATAAQIKADIYATMPGQLASQMYYPPNQGATMDGGQVTGTMRDLVPDYATPVKFPCDCRCERDPYSCGVCRIMHTNDAPKRQLPLPDTIIALNDHCRWSREKIADWLETLDLDLRFDREAAKKKQLEDSRKNSLMHKMMYGDGGNIIAGKSMGVSVLLANQDKPAENGVYKMYLGTTDAQTITNKSIIAYDPAGKSAIMGVDYSKMVYDEASGDWSLDGIKFAAASEIKLAEMHFEGLKFSDKYGPKGIYVGGDNNSVQVDVVGKITIDPEAMAELKKQFAEAAKTIQTSLKPAFDKLGESMKFFVNSPGFKALQAQKNWMNIPNNYPLPDNYSQHNNLIGEQ